MNMAAYEPWPRLDDDLLRLALLRVPLAFHNRLRLTCRRFRAAVESELFSRERRRYGLLETVFLVGGGRDAEERDELYAVAPGRAPRWRSGPKLGIHCDGLGLATCGDHVYFCGGASQRRFLFLTRAAAATRSRPHGGGRAATPRRRRAAGPGRRREEPLRRRR